MVESNTPIDVDSDIDLAEDSAPSPPQLPPTNTLIPFTQSSMDHLPYKKGPYSARIIIVGEAPGLDESLHPLKFSFVGASGQELDRELIVAGIDPSSVYMTNVVKTRPPDNKFLPWLRENPTEYQTYLQILASELAFLKDANVIVPLGAEALYAVTGKKGIENWRGSIIPCTLLGSEGRKVVPSIHPAAILRQWLYRPAVIEDFKRIKIEAETRDINLPKRTYIIRPDFDLTIAYLKKIKSSNENIACDIETLYNRIVLIQFALSPSEGIAIPFQYRNGESYWTKEQEFIVWKMIVNLLETCGKRLIGQNFITFDTFMLAAAGVKFINLLKNMLIDTMEAFRCLQPELPASLAFLTSIYTREPFYKAEGKVWNTKEGEDEFWTYGCKDVCIDHEIAPQLISELRESNMWQQYLDRYEAMFIPRMEMSTRGVKKDPIATARLEKITRFQLIKEQAKLTNLVGETINTNSFPQMKKLLYETMKLPPQYKDGKITTNEDALLNLSTKHKSDIFPLILGIRHNRVVYSNNIKSKTDSDGRLRCSFGDTETGRFTSFKNPLDTGTNMQNWSPDMREMIVPDYPNLCFIEGDLSQADARVVYWRARDEDAIALFSKICTCDKKICVCGADFHVGNATLIFRLPAEKIDKPKRYTAKRVVHAADYNMQKGRFAQVYNKDATENNMPFITQVEAGILLARFHEGRPKLRSVYHAELQEIIKKTKAIINPLGRKIVYHDRIGDELFKQAYASYAQSTVADVINTILGRVHKILCVKLQIHDSLLLQCKKDEIPDVIKLLKQAAHVPMTIEGRELIIPIEIKVGEPGRPWSKLEKYKELREAT